MFGFRRSVPRDFDAVTYLELNPDVRAAGVDPRRHYARHGRRERRRYAADQPVTTPAPAYTRARCLAGLDIGRARGLEIGPLDRPIVPPETGNIFYADHLSTAELRAKYAADAAVDSDSICEVDFDLSAMKLRDTAQDGAFDYVVASHVVEHVPDLVGWLSDVEAILADGGTLALVVPDRRFTFDLFRRESTAWMVDDAIGRERPALDTVFEYLVNVVAVDAGALWAGGDVRADVRPIHSAQTCLEIAERHRGGEYIDVHCWVFTPDSFVDLVETVVARHRLGFSVALFETTAPGYIEFVVQLRKQATSEHG